VVTAFPELSKRTWVLSNLNLTIKRNPVAVSAVKTVLGVHTIGANAVVVAVVVSSFFLQELKRSPDVIKKTIRKIFVEKFMFLFFNDLQQ
jgi:hypothetical protein